MKNRSPRRRDGFGFTLIELLVVIAIIVLLMALLSPSFRRTKELARRANCQSNQHEISLGAVQYASQNQSRLPEARTFGPNAVTNRNGWIGWSDVRASYEPYVTAEVFYCPSLNPLMSPRSPHDRAGQVVCGWSVHPTGQVGNYSALVSYTLLGCYRRIGQETRAAYMPLDRALYNPSNTTFPYDLPLLPERLARAKADAPLIGEYIHSKYPSSLTALVDGPFITDPAQDTGYGTTKVGAHVWNGTFDGMATTFMDGHCAWRGPGEAGPRAFVNNGGPNYAAVYWW